MVPVCYQGVSSFSCAALDSLRESKISPFMIIAYMIRLQRCEAKHIPTLTSKLLRGSWAGLFALCLSKWSGITVPEYSVMPQVKHSDTRGQTNRASKYKSREKLHKPAVYFPPTKKCEGLWWRGRGRNGGKERGWNTESMLAEQWKNSKGHRANTWYIC